MRRALLAVYCAAIVALSACTVPEYQLPIDYAAGASRTESEDGAFLQSASARLPLRAQPSPPATPQPSPENVTPPSPIPSPNVDSAFELASEAVSGDEELIADLSVPRGGDAPGAPASVLAEFPHYIARNEARYQSFITSFPHLSAASALALVNVNADYGYYNNISVISEPEALLVLCNKNFRLPEDYVPLGLRNAAASARKMTDEAASAFERMQAALREELSLGLVVVSAYRDFYYQRTLYNRYAAKDGTAVADTYSARAGHSEHQTGLAIDFLHRSPSGTLRAAGFQNTTQYAWLQTHAHEYGYILRYPEGFESITGYRFEPWHWRYIGVEDATRMFEEGFTTFEEYIGTYYAPVISTPV
ncbi:MAG: M15 family metallopeptidase [Oscillospiraceae bacterium]|nr:M15 family metallopeptidase [Oscillospiraceae bacterium]